jgi:LytR cell envelope-related transcriptional attenuator
VQLPFAFSVSHFVSSVGADAGFAAIIGLAILVLLYFAQARETSTLRDEASSANQRVGELERRVAQLRRPEVAPAPRPGGTPEASQQGAAPLSAARPAAATAQAGQRAPNAAPALGPMEIPIAPAGVGAPALADATRLIPAPAAAADVAAADVAAAESVALSPEPAPSPVSSAPVATAPGATTPPPATAAAGSAPRSVETATRTAPGGAGPGSNGTGEHAAAQPPPRRKLEVQSGGSLPPSLSLGGPASRSPSRRWLPAALGVLIVGAVVAVLLVVTSAGGSSKTHAAGATRSTNAPVPARAFQPSSVTVAVLNGTDVSQLAHRVAKQLTSTGYRQGTVATAADQTHTSTIVGYLPGFKRDGVEVASALKLPASSVQPVDQSARAVACPPPAACSTNVIVTVGTNLSSTT